MDTEVWSPPEKLHGAALRATKENIETVNDYPSIEIYILFHLQNAILQRHEY